MINHVARGLASKYKPLTKTTNNNKLKTQILRELSFFVVGRNILEWLTT
jgi:hypothetical protein